MKLFSYSKTLKCMAFLSFIGLVNTPSAQAQEGSIIAIVHATDPAANKPAAYAKYYVRNYFAADSRYDSIEIDKFADVDANQTGAKNIQLASEMVQKGREAYDSLELDQAIDFLNKAIQKYERNIAFLDSTRPLSDAYIALGASYILRGEEATGKKALVKAIHIDPLAKPDPRIFNPTMMEIFNDAADDANSSARGAVNVVSIPNYAEVHLDGKFIGVTPLSKGDIPSGRHIFQLRQDGYRSYGVVRDLMAHTEESISGTMEPTKEYARFRDMYARAVGQINKDGVPDAVRELANFFRVDNIFVAEVKLEGEMVAMTGAQYDIVNGQKVKMAKTTFLFDAEQFEYAVQKFMNDNFSAENLLKAPTSDNPNGCNNGTCADGSFCTADEDCQAATAANTHQTKTKGAPMDPTKKVIGFSLVGGGAGLMAIGAGLWGGAGYKANKIKNNKQSYNQQVILNMQNSGKALAVTGDVLFFVGTAAALAGTALLVFWNPQDKNKATAANDHNSHFTLGGSLAPVQGGAYATLQGTF